MLLIAMILYAVYHTTLGCALDAIVGYYWRPCRYCCDLNILRRLTWILMITVNHHYHYNVHIFQVIEYTVTVLVLIVQMMVTVIIVVGSTGTRIAVV